MTFNKNLSEYKSIVFDCDGVLINSNSIKCDAFFFAANIFGSDLASRLVDYHIKNGGISRYEKFTYFCNYLINDNRPEIYDKLVRRYSHYLSLALKDAEVIDCLVDLKNATPNANWSVVSGSDQDELRDLLLCHKISSFFEAGIFGSPDTKVEILEREIYKGNICENSLFIGDSKYDYYSSNKFNLDFIFVSNWTEVSDWRSWTSSNNIFSTASITDLINI